MNDEKQLFIQILILDMLNISDETVELLMADVPILENEIRERLRKPFADIDFSQSDVLNEIKNLYSSGYIECDHSDSLTFPDNFFQNIETFRNKDDFWFRINEKGKKKYQENYDTVWID